MEGCDQVDTRYQKTYPGLILRPRMASCKGKELFFFFVMGDGVSSAAGAERPDVFSGMLPHECGEGGGFGSTVQFSSTLGPEPIMIIILVCNSRLLRGAGQMTVVVNSAPYKKNKTVKRTS